MNYQSNDNGQMKREVGLFGSFSILAGIMIGSGIFYIGSYILVRSGMNIGLSLVIWILGGLITLMSGVCFAELGAMIPKAGGSYVYLREAYGKRIAFISGFSNFILGASGTNAALGIAFASAVSIFIPMASFTQKLFAVGTILLITIVNVFGIRFGSKLQNIFMVLKLLPIILIILCGLFKGTQPIDFHFHQVEDVNIFSLIGMISFALIATIWAFQGWNQLNGVAEEIKNPQRNLPLAIILSICGVILLYFLFDFSIYRVVSIDMIQSSLQEGNYYLGNVAANLIFGNFGKYVVGITMILSIFNSLNGCIMVYPRTYYAMAKDGAFFSSVAKLHPKYKTPTNALYVSAIVSCLLIFARDLSQLTNLVALVNIVFNGMIFYAVIILRKKYPTMHRPYRVWAYPLSIIFIVCIMTGLMMSMLIEDPITSIIGFIVPIVGLVLYHLFFYKKVGKQNNEIK